MWFIDWLKHLFNPHCDHCETRVKCESCENLKEQIAILHRQNQQLLDRLCILPEPVIEKEQRKDLEPIMQHKPWRVRRAELERASLLRKERLDQDRLSQDLTVKAPKPIEELENELGLNDATETSTGTS